ncbi:MAG: hypothetical protein DRQ47_08390 [Gammaproteobacteria bacterium]|nr:MAG: hypothetical protein DRQ47_08390 [Gammaproteobacteria bacterium]
MQLILRGHALKYVAIKLDNSLETIKYHRNNIYSKLDISSQAELFHLFISSLRAAPENFDSDPLASYI